MYILDWLALLLFAHWLLLVFSCFVFNINGIFWLVYNPNPNQYMLLILLSYIVILYMLHIVTILCFTYAITIYIRTNRYTMIHKFVAFILLCDEF